MSQDFRPGVWFQGGLNVRATVELAVRAEEAGVDSVWLAEGPVARDAFVTLSAVAMETSRVELATGVVNPFTRHPAQLAASFATLDELSHGRAVAGVGFGARDFLLPLGVDVSKPLTTAREMVQIIRGLLNREAIDLHSEKFQMDNVRLGLRPFRQGVPIFLAATGPKMCALAGQVADGIYLLYGTQSYVTSSLALANEKRPADAEPFRVASPALMAVDGDDGRALTGAKIGLGLMLTEPNGEGLLETNGINPELAQRIRNALSTGGVKALAAAVDQTIVDKLIISGSHAECVERLVDAYGWGINEPQILLSGDDPTSALKVLADTKKVLA